MKSRFYHPAKLLKYWANLKVGYMLMPRNWELSVSEAVNSSPNQH